MNWLLVTLGSLAFASGLSSVLLVRAALKRPRIGALTERAVIAVILTFFGSLSLLIRANTDLGFLFFDLETARRLFIVDAFALLLIAPTWLLLYAFDRLGDG